MSDSGLRPPGMVERECSICRWASWFDPISEEATVIPYVCKGCTENTETNARCRACNRLFKTGHRELQAMGHHWRCHNCKDIPPMQFSKTVHCWCCNCDSSISSGECCGNATQEKHYPNNCDCEACWQTWYHVCDKHAADWMYDKSDKEQKEIMKRRGARIIELGDGSWTFEFPRNKEEYPEDN